MNKAQRTQKKNNNKYRKYIKHADCAKSRFVWLC